eukprot:g11417.t1
MATVSSTGFSSGGTKDWTSAASAKPGDSVDRADGSSIGSTRRRGGERRRSSASASNAPPPPGSPPPRLARRASQRDTEPTRRKASSAHGGGGDVPHGTTRHKDDQVGRAPGVARTRCVKSSKGRPSYLVPPPADSPPFVASPHEEVIKRRRNSKAVAGRPRDIRRGGFASVGNRQHPGRSSDSGSNSDSNSNSKRSNSSSSISEVRDRHYISDNSGGSSGEAGKTYLAVDDIMSASEDNSGDRKMGSARGSEYSSFSKRDSCISRDGKQRSTSSAPRRIGDSGDDEDRPRRGRTPSTTKNHSSHDHNGTGSSAEERASSRRSPGIGKPTRRRDRTSRGTSRGDTKRSHRHRTSPTRDKEFLEDTVGEGSSSFARTERPSVGVMENEKGGRESRKKEPRAGGWFVPPEEEEKEEGGRKECSNVEEDDDGDDGDDDDDDDDDDASKGSDPDTTLCSKRLHDSKGGNLLKGGKSDEGLAPDESEGNDHGARGGRCWGEVYEQMPARCNSLMLSYDRGNTSDLVQCIIVRDRLSKKNGNYLGKVRTNLKRTEATVFTNDQEVAELGAISFEKPGLVDHLRDGSQPRKFSVLLPALDCHGAPVAHKVDPYDADSDMLSCIKQGRYGNMFLLQSREPTYTKGNYRLNFHGRVTVPSVKNFQLSSPDDKLHTVCQFGKVGEDRFHLDYRAPINAFQAFCISLAQFNF